MDKIKDFLRRVESYLAFIEKLLSSKIFLIFIFLWFIIQAIFFALSIKFGVPPDERYHLEYIQFFVDNNFLPIADSQEGFYQLGEVLKTPFFLYHYLLSVPYFVFGNSVESYIWLRLLNVAIGVASLIVIARIARILSISKLATNVALMCLVSTLMFTFLFSSITYDNLFILFSLLAALYTLKFYKSPSLRNFLILSIVLFLGLFTKITFVPIVAIVGIVILLRLFTMRQNWKKPTRQKLIKLLHAHRVMLVVFIMIGLIVVGRYATNLVSYGALQPSCTQVHTLNQCRENAVFARNEAIRDGKIREPTLSLPQYVSQWSLTLHERTIGIFAHQILLPNGMVSALLYGVFIIGLLVIVRSWRSRDKLASVALFLFIGFSLILFWENYSGYLEIGRPTFAVHGRYLFGVLPIFYLLAAHYFDVILQKRRLLKLVIACGVMSVFFLSALPTFLIKAGSAWFV